MRGWSHHVSSAALQYTLPLTCNTPKFASLLFPYHHAKPAFYGQDLCHELSRTPNAEKNLWFRDENGIPVSFEDNVELDLHDGRRACGVSFWSDQLIPLFFFANAHTLFSFLVFAYNIVVPVMAGETEGYMEKAMGHTFDCIRSRAL